MERFLCGAPHLRAQFAFTDSENPAGVPQRERERSARADCRNPVACDSGLIVNDGNLPADQTIEQRGLAYVWPADDCNIRHDVRVLRHNRPNLTFRRVGVACSL